MVSHPALFWQSAEGGSVRCLLCRHFCVIREGQTGICRVRTNRGGFLFTSSYGAIIAEQVDPIEKKPFFHFLPGTKAYSVAAPGCNFSCPFCQNAAISQAPAEGRNIAVLRSTPSDIVDRALGARCASISFTYTEPTIFFEFALDVARRAVEKGIRNNFVTNGYMSEKALREIAPVLHAANVDLKGDEEFYRTLCRARMAPVVDTIRLMRELGIWVEVTTLVVPGRNDSPETLRMIARSIAEIDQNIPWHVSRFFPAYRMGDESPTPVSSLARALEIGREAGLRYLYAGNVPGDRSESTFCHRCGALLVKRYGFSVLENRVSAGRCPECKAEISGVWAAVDGRVS